MYITGHGQCDRSVHKALHIFQHIPRGVKDYSPHTCAPIQYGQKIQYAYLLDTAEYLSDKETNLVQQVCGTDSFLNALRAKYLITNDMDATVYFGIKLRWDYVHRTVTLSMPSFVQK